MLFSESAIEGEMGISVICFNIFKYNKAVEQRRIDPVVRAGPRSVLTLSSIGVVPKETTLRFLILDML